MGPAQITFLSLPPEIRLEIYHTFMAPSPDCGPRNPKIILRFAPPNGQKIIQPVNILLTHSVIYQEFLPIFYANYIFSDVMSLAKDEFDQSISEDLPFYVKPFIHPHLKLMQSIKLRLLDASGGFGRNGARMAIKLLCKAPKLRTLQLTIDECFEWYHLPEYEETINNSLVRDDHFLAAIHSLLGRLEYLEIRTPWTEEQFDCSIPRLGDFEVIGNGDQEWLNYRVASVNLKLEERDRVAEHSRFLVGLTFTKEMLDWLDTFPPARETGAYCIGPWKGCLTMEDENQIIGY